MNKFYSKQTSEDVIALSDIASKTTQLGWKGTFINFVKGRSAKEQRFLIHNLRNQKFTGWKFLLDIKKESRILILGTGFDNTAFSLSALNNKVTIVEKASELMAFMQDRVQGKEQLELVKIESFLDLPFKNGQFDLVIENRYSRALHAQGFEVNYSEVNRVLNNSGQYYFVGRNSWDYEAFLGKNKVNPFYDVQDKNSRPGYEKALKKAGFAHSWFYALYPDFERPSQAFSLDDPQWGYEPRIYSKGIKALPQKILGWRKALKYGSSVFAIVARKNNKHQALAEYILDDIASKMDATYFAGEPAAWKIDRYFLTNDEKIVLLVKRYAEKERHYIVKIPLNKFGQKKIEINSHILNRFHKDKIIAKKWLHLLPKIFLESEINGQYYIVEQALPAETRLKAGNLPLKDHQRLVEESVDFLIDLQTKQPKQLRLTKNEIEKRFTKPLLETAHYCGLKSDDDRIKKIIAKQNKELLDVEMPLVTEHGDFGLHNVLISAKTKNMTAIIDWDRGLEERLPMIDLFHLLVFNEKQDQLPQRFKTMLFPNKYEQFEQKMLDKYCKKLNINPKLYQSLAIHYWISWVHYFIETDQDIHQGWIKHMFYDVISYWDG